METSGWQNLDGTTRDAFERVLQTLRKQGVGIVRRTDSTLVEAFELGIAEIGAINSDLCAYETWWSLSNLDEQHPGKLSKHALRMMERGRAMSQDDCRRRLVQIDDARRRLAAIAPLGDALLSLSSPGPAPIHDPDAARPTGDAVFNYPSSSLRAPAVTIPLLAIGGMPCGIQVMGQPRDDARVAAIARWVADNVEPLKVG
jgi:Asp-tRNA(Asn)/Glu-tRNA(Gln) amidotransferase A subunit family amidase